MTMIEEKLSRLIVALIEKTESGKVTWNKTVSMNRYLANFSQNAISIKRFPSELEEDRTHYIFSLLNGDGEEIESKYTEWPGRRTDYRNLEKLFNLARRSAQNVEENIDSLLQTLEQE